jgi:hypothetical protein
MDTDLNRLPPGIADLSGLARALLGSHPVASQGRLEDVELGQAALSSSSHSTAVIGTVTDSVGANASIGPWISRSRTWSLTCDPSNSEELLVAAT